MMCLKIMFIVTLIQLFSSVISKRIPHNSCPDVFKYYKTTNGVIYGQVTVPYDRQFKLVFSVNCSYADYLNKPESSIELITIPDSHTQPTHLRYNILFDNNIVIPKITEVKYNDKIYCSGPPEPLIPGAPGVTNSWRQHVYSYSTFSSVSNSNNNKNNPTEAGPVQTDEDIEIQEPYSSALKPDFQNTNPFFNKVPNNNRVNLPTATATLKPDSTQLSDPNTNSDDNSIFSNNKKFECGNPKVAIVALILGGEEVTDGLFPWLAAMFLPHGTTYRYKCTANLISDRHVVTAARCVQYFKVQIVKTEDLLFVFGTKDISRWATNGAITRGAKRVQTHPEFDFNSAHGDVSIITLDRPLVFTNNISPICLWNGPNDLKDIVTMRGKAAGWGIDDNSNDGQLSVPVARFVEMPVVSQEDCLYSNFSFGTLTSDMTFCAGDRNKKGPCIGDSGAGFMLKKKEKYYLRGIVSLTLGDSKAKCDLENYTVFCDIAKCMDWIQKAMAN